jgi:adenylate kinase
MSECTGCTIFVCGISGVGKTHLIRAVLGQLKDALTWRASEMIAEARQVFDPEQLRTLAPTELQQSQELLVAGFATRRRMFTNELVLLDAHSVIDTNEGLFDIPVVIVARLKTTGIIHVTDEPGRIYERRSADRERVRPSRSVAQLEVYQSRSIANCESYCSMLHVPLTLVHAGDENAFERTIRGIVEAGHQPND